MKDGYGSIYTSTIGEGGDEDKERDNDIPLYLKTSGIIWKYSEKNNKIYENYTNPYLSFMLF